MKKAKATMKDVAREAGVALGTVSKVMNNIPVGEEYRIRVEEAAERLGYEINTYARGLRTDKSGLVAVIVPMVHHPYFGLLVDYVTSALKVRGLQTLLATTELNPEAENECIRLVYRNKVDGIIALTYNPDIEIDETIPFVSIDRFYTDRVPCVASDNYRGGQLAAEKLVELGAKNLLFLRIGSEVYAEPDKREGGFTSWCSMYEVPHKILHVNDEAGTSCFLDFLEEHTREGRCEYDGIFCCTDHVAVNVIRKLRELGCRIPEDVQVIGFDGLVDYADKKPLCSSIVQPVSRIAETAVDILLSKDLSSQPALTCLPVEFRPGGTTREIQAP